MFLRNLLKHSPVLLICAILFLAIWPRVAAQDVVPQDSILIAPDSSLIAPDTALIAPDSTLIAPDTAKVSFLEAPVDGVAKDSVVMVFGGGSSLAYFYGQSEIKYMNLDLTAEYVSLDADSSTVYASYGVDSIGEEFGYPVFKEGEQEYEMKKVKYNFKTKKSFITDVITQQGEGYVTAHETKKMANDDLFMRNGKYTTCDEHDHPHFYFQLTKAKIIPGKSAVSGPAYLVIEDVPLPVAVPFAFFPFTKDYSSGVLMPTVGEEMSKGFFLKDGGYYFAFNDYMDLAVTADIFTKGSWGTNLRSKYTKRYKFSGNFNAGYTVTINGEKGSPDYMKSKDMKLDWTHMQDPKASPFSTFSANVRFSTSSYDRNNLNSINSTSLYDNTKSSSVNYQYKFPNAPLSIQANMTVNQQSRDTMISMTLPNLTITLSDIYPFRRKEQIGKSLWYESIRMSYTGMFKNSINAKEYEIMHTNLIKDWSNGMKHDIPVSTNFNLFKYINVSPSFTYNSRWLTNQVDQQWDYNSNRLAPSDTTYGFYRVYNYSAQVSASTKLYGFYKPWNLLGNWTKGIQIRHVFTPSISFQGAPNFSDPKFGYYKTAHYYDRTTHQQKTVPYYAFGGSSNSWLGMPPEQATGSATFSVENNLEMKVPAGVDSTKKISLIDNLRLNISYNALADSFKWSDLGASLRLKLGKQFTLNLQGTFDTYTYDENGRRINVPRWEAGKGLGRLRQTGTSFSYSLSNETLKKWFSKGDEQSSGTGNTDTGMDDGLEGDELTDGTQPPGGEIPPSGSLRKKKQQGGDFDADGYMIMNIPWNLSFNYSLGVSYDNSSFNQQTREFDYRLNQSLGLNGSITPAKGWTFSFNTNYDFDAKQFATLQCNISRNMHCWMMSASFIPVGPYQYYTFTISASSSMLKDLKYTQSSNYRDAMHWD